MKMNLIFNKNYKIPCKTNIFWEVDNSRCNNECKQIQTPTLHSKKLKETTKESNKALSRYPN